MRRRRKAPRPRVPKGIERRYSRALVRVSREVSRAINAVIRPHLAFALEREKEADAREDAEIPTATLGVDFGRLRIKVGKIVRGKRVSAIVDQWGREISEWNTADMERVLRIDLATMPVGLRETLADLRRENVALIESIGTQQLDDVARVVTESVARGTRVEVLARQVQERYGVSDSRARLIARDQTLKANSNLTAERHREAGITEYVWSSSRDERVREMHADLNGSVQKWNAPPITSEDGATNHPGSDYQCRCVAIPVLD